MVTYIINIYDSFGNEKEVEILASNYFIVDETITFIHKNNKNIASFNRWNQVIIKS